MRSLFKRISSKLSLLWLTELSLVWLALTSCGSDQPLSADSPLPSITAPQGGTVMPIDVTSSTFTHGGPIPAKYSCQGQEISPPLSWSGLPGETKSLAIIMDDPDAP